MNFIEKIENFHGIVLSLIRIAILQKFLKTPGFFAFSVLFAFFLLLPPAFSQNLYVGSNSAGQTLTLDSGTNSYSNTYVGYNMESPA